MQIQVVCPGCHRADPGSAISCQWCSQILAAPPGVELAGLGIRLVAYILEVILAVLTLGIGYLVWMLIVFKDGQTPGKQLLGLRVARMSGETASWWRTFAREVLARAILAFLVGWFFAIHILWALWDKNRQTLYDKLADTIVVKGPRVPPKGV